MANPPYAHTLPGKPAAAWEPLFTPFGDGADLCQRDSCQKCKKLDPYHGHLNKVAFWTAKFAAEMFPPDSPAARRPNPKTLPRQPNSSPPTHPMSAIALFQDKNIRRTWDTNKKKWMFATVDVVLALTGQTNRKDSIKKPEGSRENGRMGFQPVSDGGHPACRIHPSGQNPGRRHRVRLTRSSPSPPHRSLQTRHLEPLPQRREFTDP